MFQNAVAAMYFYEFSGGGFPVPPFNHCAYTFILIKPRASHYYSQLHNGGIHTQVCEEKHNIDLEKK